MNATKAPCVRGYRRAAFDEFPKVTVCGNVHNNGFWPWTLLALRLAGAPDPQERKRALPECQYRNY